MQLQWQASFNSNGYHEVDNDGGIDNENDDHSDDNEEDDDTDDDAGDDEEDDVPRGVAGVALASCVRCTAACSRHCRRGALTIVIVISHYSYDCDDNDDYWL